MKRYFFAYASIIAVGAFAGFALGFFSAPRSTAPAAGTTLPSATALFETSLAGRITTSDTSMTLAANSVGGTTLSGYNCFTIDEGRTDSEFVCGTISGTSVTSLERGISFTNGTTTSASLAHAHRVGANVKITDHPLLARLMAQNNGTDTFPNILSYDHSPDFTGASTSAIVSYGLLQQTSFAGTVNGNESTKGIYELATGREAASSTLTGSTAARLALSTSNATDTPQNCTASNGGCLVMSLLNGKLNQAWTDFTQLFTFSGGLLSTGSTTISTPTTTISSLLAIATSTPPAAGFKLALSGNAYITGGVSIGVASSTMGAGTLVVQGTASTTNLIVSGTCTNCATNGYTTVTNTGAGPTVAGATAAVTATCAGSQKVVGGGASDNQTDFKVFVSDSNPTGGNAWAASYDCYAGSGGCAANTMTAYAICVNP